MFIDNEKYGFGEAGLSTQSLFDTKKKKEWAVVLYPRRKSSIVNPGCHRQNLHELSKILGIHIEDFYRKFSRAISTGEKQILKTGEEKEIIIIAYKISFFICNCSFFVQAEEL